MDRTSKRILESIIRLDKMPCSHCALTKECTIYNRTTKKTRAQYRKSSSGYGDILLCRKFRWLRFLREQMKGLHYDIEID